MGKTQIVNTEAGRKMYYVDGKLTNKEAYEGATKEKTLEDQYSGLGVTVEDKSKPQAKPVEAPEAPTTSASVPTTMPKITNERVCVFCDGFANRTRFVNMQTVRLCEKDYLDNTLGEVAAHVRKKYADG